MRPLRPNRGQSALTEVWSAAVLKAKETVRLTHSAHNRLLLRTIAGQLQGLKESGNVGAFGSSNLMYGKPCAA